MWRWFSAFTFLQFEHSVITQILRTAEGARAGSRCITGQAWGALVSRLMLPPASWEQRNKKEETEWVWGWGFRKNHLPHVQVWPWLQEADL